MLLWDKNKMYIARPALLFFAICALYLAPFFLAACGFSPMYGSDTTQDSTVTAGFDQVYVENIPDRTGQYLRNALIDRLYSHGRPANAAYTLSIQTVSETKTDLDITKSSDATRAQMRLSTSMTMTDQATGREIIKRKLVSITSYNVLQSHFTTSVSEDNARRNALDDLARQIEQQLALYFSRQPAF